MLLHRPGAWQLAWNAYIHGSLTMANFDEPTLTRLRTRLPHLDAATANGPARRAVAGPARSGRHVTGRDSPLSYPHAPDPPRSRPAIARWVTIADCL